MSLQKLCWYERAWQTNKVIWWLPPCRTRGQSRLKLCGRCQFDRLQNLKHGNNFNAKERMVITASRHSLKLLLSCYPISNPYLQSNYDLQSSIFIPLSVHTESGKIFFENEEIFYNYASDQLPYISKIELKQNKLIDESF